MLSPSRISNNYVTMLIPKVPFREAHGMSGQCVALAEKNKCQLTQLALQDLKNIRYSYIFAVRAIALKSSGGLTGEFSDLLPPPSFIINFLPDPPSSLFILALDPLALPSSHNYCFCFNFKDGCVYYAWMVDRYIWTITKE